VQDVICFEEVWFGCQQHRMTGVHFQGLVEEDLDVLEVADRWVATDVEVVDERLLAREDPVKPVGVGNIIFIMSVYYIIRITCSSLYLLALPWN